MSSRITILGNVSALLPSENDKKVVASFEPLAKNAPPIVVSAYGAIGQKLTEMVGSTIVAVGQFIPTTNEKGNWAMNGFSINIEELFPSTEWGESQVLVSILGKYSDRYSEYAQAGSWTKYNFGISHSFMPKKEDGKYPYANWKITKLGKDQEEIQSRFTKYLKDGDLLEATVSLSWYEKKDGSIGMSASLKNHSFVGGNRND